MGIKDPQQILGVLISQYMYQQDISISEMSRRVGVSHTTIRKIMQNASAPSLTIADEILQAMGFTITIGHNGGKIVKQRLQEKNKKEGI